MGETKDETISDSLTQYVVVFRSKSAPIFTLGTQFKINVVLPNGILILSFKTRHVDKGLDILLPGDLCIDARGPAKNLESAVSIFGPIADNFATIICFATNAAIGSIEPELAYNITSSFKTREFLQSMIPDEQAIIKVGRKVNSDATLNLMQAIQGHSEIERISRAMAQYRLALDNWRQGHEILSTAHLYIGMETLTKAIIRHQLAATGINEEQLATKLGVNTIELSPDKKTNAIEAAARKEILFQGDHQCYKDAKMASDGFEHGYMPFNEIRDKAKTVRDKTAAFLRKSILDVIPIAENARKTLLNAPYNDPLGTWPVIKYMRGQLSGDLDKLDQTTKTYPSLSWRSNIKSAGYSESDQYTIEFEEKFTAHLGDGISFQPESFEVWAP